MHMYVNGNIVIGGKFTYEMARERYFCRELALAAFRRQTLGRVTFSAGDINHVLLYLLVLQRLPVQMELNIYLESSTHRLLTDKLIADVRELLATHYPSVTLEMHAEPIEQQGGLRRGLIQGYTLRGNSQIIPAFFWSLFFFREVIERVSEYTTLAALLEAPPRSAQLDHDEDDDDDDDDDSFHSSHREAFARLLAGTEPAAEYMLASGYGPIDTFEGGEQQRLTDSLARIERNGAMRRYEEILNNVVN